MAKRKTDDDESQGTLFAASLQRARPAAPAATAGGKKEWRMPELPGTTVAEIRLRWSKRLTPAQAARVEGELGELQRVMTKLGFGKVDVERIFVRRRQK